MIALETGLGPILAPFWNPKSVESEFCCRADVFIEFGQFLDTCLIDFGIMFGRFLVDIGVDFEIDF